MSIFKGSGVALVTPFKDNEIDYKSLKRIINYQIKNKTDAIIICGTTGEASTLSYEEQLSCIKFCVDVVDKRVPVIAGTGSNCTKSAIMLAKEAEKLGVDGLLIVTPYYNKATQNGLIKHYTSIAENVSIPILLYNVPSRTGCNIEPETVISLVKNVDNIVGIKEASGDIEQVAKITSLAQNNNINLDIYSGNDDQVYNILDAGGIGVISVNANIIPYEMHNLVEQYMKGNYIASKGLQYKANMYAKELFSEVNPIPIKRALFEVGLIDSPELRLPLTDLEKEHVISLRKVLKKDNKI